MFVNGFRGVRVLTSVTQGDFTDLRGAVGYAEVTNDTAGTILFTPNDQDTRPSDQAIPIKAGTTRVLPMTLYNFHATGALTVVAYYK